MDILMYLMRGLGAGLAGVIVFGPYFFFKSLKNKTIDNKITKRCTPQNVSAFLSEEDEKKFVKYKGIYYLKKEVYDFVINHFSAKSERTIKKEIAKTEKNLKKNPSNKRFYNVKLEALKTCLLQ